jgi:antitoxin component YwqK of YwqJK toxin-antitoxin module
MKILKIIFIALFGVVFYGFLHTIFYYELSAGLAIAYISIGLFIIGLVISIIPFLFNNKFQNRIFYSGIFIQFILSLLFFSSYGHFILKTNKKYCDQIISQNYKDGLVEIYYLNGVVKERASIKNHQFNGQFELYDFKGELIQQGNYINSKKDGEWKIRFSSKGNWTYQYYKMGKKNGQWIYVDSNGKNKLDVTYIGNDSVVNNTWNYSGSPMVINGNGVHIESYNNSEPKIVLPFEKGKIHGTVFEFNENGDTIRRKEYFN